MKISTAVVSLTNIETAVVTTSTAACNSSSCRAHKRNSRVPKNFAAPVRTMAPPNTNMETTITTATLPNPENPS